ncbi:MAG TPA: penicillin-binding protein 2, partial [Roseiflexaceae bacterium]|nr:penicillin-binding protein 2 [Roseiflexaceae bacterium]
MAARSSQSAQNITVSRWRLNSILVVVLLLFARIGVQLGDIQLVRGGELRDRARSEIDQRILVPSQRGTIRDSKGNVLALNVQFRSLFIQPHLVNDKDAPKLALVLSGLLGMPAGD